MTLTQTLLYYFGFIMVDGPLRDNLLWFSVITTVMKCMHGAQCCPIYKLYGLPPSHIED